MGKARDTRFLASRGRSERRPEHRWYIEAKPWEIQPVAIAPVLPGERMRECIWQSRVVTDPLAGPLIGWWQEYFLFYCPLSLLPEYDAFKALVESGDIDTTLTATAADVPAYYAGRGINWTRSCLDLIVKEWFRPEDERAASPAPAIRTGRPAARLGIDGIEHSLRTEANYPGGTGGALGATQRAQEDDLRAYEVLRDQGLVQMDYEDWLRTYGVSSPEAIRRRRPYLLRHVKQWQYPSNTVNQTSGVPVTAVSWTLTERANKQRYFAEPGFLIMLSVTRPKVYRSNQEAAGVSVMDRLRYFLPAMLRDDPMTSMRIDTATSSPLYDTVAAADHWVDVRDLLVHGDQFVGQAFTSTRDNSVALPTAALEAQYATEAMADTLFTNPEAAGLLFVRQDGIVRFVIDGATEDTKDATART